MILSSILYSDAIQGETSMLVRSGARGDREGRGRRRRRSRVHKHVGGDASGVPTPRGGLWHSDAFHSEKRGRKKSGRNRFEENKVVEIFPKVVEMFDDLGPKISRAVGGQLWWVHVSNVLLCTVCAPQARNFGVYT